MVSSGNPSLLILDTELSICPETVPILLQKQDRFQVKRLIATQWIRLALSSNKIYLSHTLLA